MRWSKPVDKTVAIILTVVIVGIGLCYCSRSREIEIYKVSGTLTPDATGDYVETGLYKGKKYYTSTEPTAWNPDLYYTIKWNGVDSWVLDYISASSAWLRADSDITGEYSPTPGFTGTATVTRGFQSRRSRDL